MLTHPELKYASLPALHCTRLMWPQEAFGAFISFFSILPENAVRSMMKHARPGESFLGQP